MTIYVLCGPAGAGKTTLGKALAAHLHATFLDKDDLARPLVEGMNQAVGLDPDCREGDLYVRHVRPREYQGLHRAIFSAAQYVAHVVCVAPWGLEVRNSDWVHGMQARAALAGHSLVLCWVHCDNEIRRERLERRGDPADAEKLRYWDSHAQIEAPDCVDVAIDTSAGATGDHVDALLAHLSRTGSW